MSKLYPLVSENDQYIGDPLSTITLVEYGDYQCPHCGRAHPFVKRLLEERAGSFLFVFRNFPLQQIHPAAFIAAATAEAAGRQGHFWTMHNFIFEHQVQLRRKFLLEFAATLEMNSGMFFQDLDGDAIKEKIEFDFESGLRSGVNRTPTFYMNGEKIHYDATYESLLLAFENFEATR